MNTPPLFNPIPLEQFLEEQLRRIKGQPVAHVSGPRKPDMQAQESRILRHSPGEDEFYD